MPLKVDELVNGLSDSIINNPGIGAVARNPIYTGLLITFIIVLIILFVFRDSGADNLLWLTLRSGFYIFISMLVILFLHNKVLIGETHEVAKGSEVANVFGGGEVPSDNVNVDDQIVPVSLNIGMSEFP